MAYNSWEDVRPQEGKQQLAFDMIGQVDFMLWGGARFGGKALPLDTVVHTREGPKLLKDLTEEDYVWSPLILKWVKVLKLHPITLQETIRFVFEDGDYVDSSLDHKWLCDLQSQKQPHNQIVRTTEQIIYCLSDWEVSIPYAEDSKDFHIPERYSKVGGRKIVSYERLSVQPMRCITVDSEDGLFVIGHNYVVTHNSELLSMVPLKFIDDPSYRGIFFRRSYDEIMGSNSLWEKAQNMYPLFDGQPKMAQKAWYFPHPDDPTGRSKTKLGARQFYRHMQTEQDKETHRGKG